MVDTYVQRLEFTVAGQPDDTFAVFRLAGREAISELFRFEVDLVSQDRDLELEPLIGRDASLTITRLEQSRTIHGMLDEIELHGTTPHGAYVYKAILVPRLRRLALSRQNQIHGTSTPVSVKEVLAEELTANALKGPQASSVSGRLGLQDFELRFVEEYPQRDYIVQYDETDFAFISRLCEHYGIFYFFTHDTGRDVVVFADGPVAFPKASGPDDLAYRTISGLANAEEASVYRFIGRHSLVPAKVCLRDYNYRLPNLALEVDETVDANGHGVVVEFGSHFRTPQEGRDLARVRAQELACRKRVFEGASDSVHLTAGVVFDLTDHFHDAFNAGYLVTWIEHEATQALPGIAEFTGPNHQASYRNRFECLPKTVEFRPARKTPKPRMPGLSNAVVDASGAGRRAEIDASGRYKIRQQFDQRGEAAGQSSRYMRKSEPYGGANTGMHFPLLKGTEVILACVNGDPDRPIIVGAMQNAQYPSIVTSSNSTTNRMRTTSGALFEIDDGPAGGGGGSGAGGGTLAPQRALEGLGPNSSDAPAPAVASDSARSRTLVEQRAEADIVTTGGATSSYGRLHITSVSDTYWRLGSVPTDTTEATRKPTMSDMAGGNAAGGAGLFEYAAGDRSSLIKGSSYRQVDANDLDYVIGNRRMSAANHNAVSKGQYQVIASGIAMQATSVAITDNSSPAAAPAGDLVVTTSGNFTQTIGANTSTSTTGNVITKTKGTDVKQTWGSTAAFMMGSSISMTLGSSLGVTLGAKTDIFGLMKIDIGLGILDFKYRLGPVVDFASSAKISAVGGADIKAKFVEFGSYLGTKMENAAVSVLDKLIDFDIGPIDIELTEADISMGLDVHM